VLREEIRNRLWPNDTFVQFAPSINAAIQRLREALGDTANEPRYVETVARRGYRLLAKIAINRNGTEPRTGETSSARVSSSIAPASVKQVKVPGSIAVLPFENASRDPEGDYLSAGITENIINSLSKLSGLRVMPRSTVFRYRRKVTNPQAIGRELEVEAVLAGRVTQRDGALVVSAELIEVSQGSQLWGERYNRRLADLYEVEEEIAKKISESLRVQLNVRRTKAALNALQKTVRPISLICEAATAGTGGHRTTYERVIDIFSKQSRTTRVTPWLIRVWPTATATCAR